MSSNVRVSVIIPVYQGERFILGALDSALNQTHRNLEILVIDDGSTDKTWPLLQSVTDSRVRCFQQTNSGASAARNVGLQHSSGEYVAFLDADDLWFPDKIENELDAFKINGDAVGIAFSWYYCVDEDGAFFRRSAAVRHSGNVLDDLLNAKLFIIPSASLFHRGVFETVGMFDTTRRYHEDMAFVLRACRSFPAFPTLRYSAIYRQSINGKARRIIRDYDVAVEAQLSIAADVSEVLSESQASRLLDNLRTELYWRFLMYGCNESATRLLKTMPAPPTFGGVKASLGWLFAKTHLNLMLPGRTVAQGVNRFLSRFHWRRFLRKSGVPNTATDRPRTMRLEALDVSSR